MAIINIPLEEEQYQQVKEAAAKELLPITTYARRKILLPNTEPTKNENVQT